MPFLDLLYSRSVRLDKVIQTEYAEEAVYSLTSDGGAITRTALLLATGVIAFAE